jgi:hypothetical protein
MKASKNKQSTLENTNDETDSSENLQRQAELLDSLRRRLDLNSDKALAEVLALKAPFVSDIRTGKRALPNVVKLKILDKLGYLWARDALLALTPKGFSQKLKDADNSRLKIDLSKIDDSQDEAQYKAAKEFMDAVEKAAPILGPEVLKSIVTTKLLELLAKRQK